MNSTDATPTIRDRVQQIETMPAIPAVFLPLMNLLSSSGDDVKLDEVVRLVSYDSNIAGQCLRVAASPLFGLAKPPESIKAAVLTLGPSGSNHYEQYLGGASWPYPLPVLAAGAVGAVLSVPVGFLALRRLRADYQAKPPRACFLEGDRDAFIVLVKHAGRVVEQVLGGRDGRLVENLAKIAT